ncbi:MAG: hypothetical protein KDC80_14450 [Saprospiraceae bacterium]|nr:hypothetical protein [Saprospiraceae bacterium]
MKSALRTILFIVGLGLIGYGIYMIVSPDVQAEVLGIEFSASDNEISTESIILIALGIIAIALPRLIR